MTRVLDATRMRRIGWGLLVPALLIGIHGCTLFFRAPSVKIVGVDLVSLGLNSGTAEVSLEVTNQESREMQIRGFLYEIEVGKSREGGGWNQLAEGFHDNPVTIPGGQTVTVKVPVPFEYSAVGEAVRRLLSTGDLPYRMKGEVWLGGGRMGLQIPFRSQGTIRP
jgi:LEA14-like dessication related protein